MGLIDMFGSEATCPLCGNNAAKKLLFLVHCPNRACVNGGAKPPRKPLPRRSPDQWPVDPDFKPGPDAVAVRYKNFAGEERTFTGDRRTLADRGSHVSLRVAPSGERLSLAKDRILNPPEIQPLLPKNAAPAAKPTPAESQILGYHRKRKSTSPALEKILKQHPDWR